MTYTYIGRIIPFGFALPDMGASFIIYVMMAAELPFETVFFREEMMESVRYASYPRKPFYLRLHALYGMFYL